MLSKTERDYLLDKVTPTASHRRVLKHKIRNKLKEFYMLELPLIQRSGITEFNNIITEFNNGSLENIKLRTGFDPATFTLPR